MSDISRRDLLASGLALSASSLVSRSTWGRVAQAMGQGSPEALPQADFAVAPRERLLFDFGWKFTFGR
jgi:beta-galactosidase